jgi:protein-tyrosine phosphatase
VVNPHNCNSDSRYGWPDHNAPSLSHLLKIIQHIDDWCKQDPKNVCVIHCKVIYSNALFLQLTKAGRGRTGTVIGAYLVYNNSFDDSEAALQFFAAKRSATKEGGKKSFLQQNI